MQLTEVRRNYDWAAPHYDFWTDLVFRRILRLGRYRERTVALLGDLEEKTVLDVGCGTGRNFPLLVPRVGNSGRIVGVDYSQGMLEQARERVEAQGWRNIELMHGDATKLEGVPEQVDAMVSVWCLGIVYDLGAALQRAIGLLRPGGHLAIMDFERARPDHGVLHWLYPLYSLILRREGISGAEDLDDDKLRSKWKEGRQLLKERLVNVREERYLQGGGLIIAGEKPSP